MRATLFALTLMAATPIMAQDTEPPMSPLRMAEIIQALDPDVTLAQGGMAFTISDVPVLLVADVAANRMRAMVPIRAADDMTPDEVMRVMQANFDTALDARYAIANGQLWAVFIHPLKELERDQLISGIGQTVNIALTYGGLYSGGAVQFGGGDSNDLQRELLDDLLQRGQDI